MSPANGIGEAPKLDGTVLRVAILHARWNTKIIEALVQGARKSLSALGVKDEDIILHSVPGSFELPLAASALANPINPLANRFNAIIAIGVLIKGETMHFEYIAEAVSHGLMKVQLETGKPIVFGLLTVLNEEQGLARAGLTAGGHNHGEDWGSAAVELAVKQRDEWGI